MRWYSCILVALVVPVSGFLMGCPPEAALGVSATVHHFPVNETTWTFEVFNDGSKGTTLVFNITTDRGWIQVNPANGQSTGEDNPVTITVTIDRDYAAKAIPSFATGTITVDSSVGQKKVAISTAPDYFTQSFNSNVDLGGRTFTFSPNGSLSFYGATQEEGITGFPTNPAGGLVLDFGIADPVKVFPLYGFLLPFYEAVFSSIYIGSNGTIGYGTPGSDASPEDHFAQPQISVFPLDAASGGDVSLLQDEDKLIVTYENVPTADLKQPTTNDIQVELFFDGDIRISYLNADPAAVGVIGLSSGAGEDGELPPGFVETDFSDVNTGPAKAAL